MALLWMKCVEARSVNVDGLPLAMLKAELMTSNPSHRHVSFCAQPVTEIANYSARSFSDSRFPSSPSRIFILTLLYVGDPTFPFSLSLLPMTHSGPEKKAESHASPIGPYQEKSLLCGVEVFKKGSADPVIPLRCSAGLLASPVSPC